MATSKKYDIDDLTIPQLSQFSKAVDEEIRFLQESLEQLKIVKHKFNNSRETVKLVDPKEANKQHLIPLTETLFVKAKVPNPDEYLIEIGTGYYVQMNRQKAMEFFERKEQYLDDRVNEVEKILNDKRVTRQALMSSLQEKIGKQTSNNSVPVKA
uniref:Prefoldin subunit 5 n=1 Tax=Parastrongyloides trichosuri TaxID=131310 RepID=A0A0N4ZTC3_PARTI